MRKIKAFTLIEVMVSIFIFTTAMLGFMSFHAHSMSVIFDNESAQFAHAIAFNLVEEINSMSFKDFKSLAAQTSSRTKDTILKSDNYMGATYGVSPFYMTGDYSSESSYRFNRYIQTLKYTDELVSGAYVAPGSFMDTLYVVRVEVFWPKRGYGTKECYKGVSNFDKECNSISLPLVRSNKQTFKVAK